METLIPKKNISSWLYHQIRNLWLGLRSILELLISHERLDRWLDKIGFFSFKSKCFRSIIKLPDESIIVYRPDDKKILEEIYEHGSYSCGVIRDGDVIIDVGAHIGVFTIYAAKKNPHGRIISIEPAPLNLELLRENVEKNGLRNVKIYKCAISDHRGEDDLFFGGNYDLYSLYPTTPGAIFIRTQLQTLDDIFRAEHLSVCHLLKVDVEGAELMVLKGGIRTLAVTCQVIVEACKKNDFHQKIISFLKDLGFTCSVEIDNPGGIILYASRRDFFN